MIERYLAIDFETSGVCAFDASGNGCHVPIEIGIVEMFRGEPVKEFQSLIGPLYENGKPVGKYDAKAMEVSGITMDEIALKPTPLDIVESLMHIQEWHQLPVVAYNKSFDWSFYRRLLQLARRRNFLWGKWHCAHTLAKQKLVMDRYRLVDVAARLGIEPEGNHHRALSDAILAGRAYWELQKLTKGQLSQDGRVAPSGPVQERVWLLMLKHDNGCISDIDVFASLESAMSCCEDYNTDGSIEGVAGKFVVQEKRVLV